MTTKRIKLNPGAQYDFVTRHIPNGSAYIGGVGSGKTFGGLIKGLRMQQQPIAADTMWGPRGLVGASSFGVLKKVIVPQFYEVMDGSGLWKTGKRATSWVKSEMRARLIANCACKDPHTCDHESEIFLASLDDPDELRGMELSWFHIDEGRNTTGYAWEVLLGRLRQEGYDQAGWVVSTPNGYDWLYDYFHEDSTSEKHIEGAEWFNAAVYENESHVGREYIERLEAQYHGRFFEQEVLGRFVGMTEGAVFFEWDPKDGAHEVPYRPDLPLYSEWDFGMGDETVILFWQLDHEEWRPDPASARVLLKPIKRYVGALEAPNRTIKAWAKVFFEYCDEHFNGRRPNQNDGDPAGRQRTQESGKSTIELFAEEGITINPAEKRPIDYAVGLGNNLMADHRVIVDRTRCMRLTQALSSHKWPVDTQGRRKGNKPVHDWTSHYCDAFRYGTTVHIHPVTREKVREEQPEHQPGTYGYVFDQVLARAEDDREYLGGPDAREIDVALGRLGG